MRLPSKNFLPVGEPYRSIAHAAWAWHRCIALSLDEPDRDAGARMWLDAAWAARGRYDHYAPDLARLADVSCMFAIVNNIARANIAHSRRLPMGWQMGRTDYQPREWTCVSPEGLRALADDLRAQADRAQAFLDAERTVLRDAIADVTRGDV